MPGTVLGARDPLMNKAWSRPSRSSEHVCVSPFILPSYFFLSPHIHAPLRNYPTRWGLSLPDNNPDGGFTRQDYLGMIFS